MRIITGFKINEEANVYSKDDGALHAGIIGKGDYILNIGSQLDHNVQDVNTLRIFSGEIVMQGRHGRIDTYEDAIIDNGGAGFNRIDLIVCEYKREDNGEETMQILTIKGTPTMGLPQIPDYDKGDILAGAKKRDMPLFEIQLEGVNIKEIRKRVKILNVNLDQLGDVKASTTIEESTKQKYRIKGVALNE